MRGSSSSPGVIAFPRRVRFRRFGRRIFRSVFGAFARFAPDAAASRAEQMFLTPPRCTRTPFEQETLEAGSFEALESPYGTLATWRWGQGPTVLLLHGWGGHAGRLARFVEPLVTEGFSVVALDAPGHGDSPPTRCSLPDVADSIRLLAQKTAPFGVVGHSLGATAAALAARSGAAFSHAVFLAPAATPEDYPWRFGRFLGLPESGCEFMKRRLEARYRIRWNDVSVDRFAPSMTARLLVLHDPRDRKVPFREGRAIASAWPNARLVEVRGVGHHRILHAPEVVREAVAFLGTGARERPPVSACAS